MSDPNALCPGCFQVETTGPCPSCGFQLDPTAFPTALKAGTLLQDRYLVGRVLEKPGGFGVTYLTYDMNLQRRLAMKELMPRDLLARRPDGATLAPHTQDDETLFAYTKGAFLSEARTLARFSHPNVVRIHDYFEANGTAYFTMEYYQGETLSAHLRRQGGKLSGERALELMLPVVDALGEIHDLGVLHRDIKPSNIYLTERGDAILLDFGSARQAMGEKTRTLTSVLTPGYAPFEQYHEKGKQGPWTDVYGCAATLYALVAGTVPPDAPSRIADDDLVPPLRLAPVGEAINGGILEGLALRVEDRPATMAQFRARLTGSELAPGAGGATTHVWVAGAVDATATNIMAGTASPLPPAQDVDTGTERWAPGTVPSSLPPTGPSIPPPPPTVSPRRKSGVPWVGVAAALAIVTLGGFGVVTLMGGDDPSDATIDEDPTSQVVTNGAEAATDEVAQPASQPADGGTQADAVADQNPPEPVPVEPATSNQPAVASSGGEAQPEAASTAPAAANIAPTVLVIVYGEAQTARRAESTLQRTLIRETGLDAVDPRGLEMARADRDAVQAALAGDFGALADLGREFGAEYLMVGELSSAANPSVGNFFTGSAELDVNVYRASTGGLVDGEVFSVGSGNIPGKLGQNAMDAESQAVQEVSQSAAQATGRWIRRLR